MSTDKEGSKPDGEQRIRARRLARTLESFDPGKLSNPSVQLDGAAPEKSLANERELTAKAAKQEEPLAKTLLEHEAPIDSSQPLTSVESAGNAPGKPTEKPPTQSKEQQKNEISEKEKTERSSDPVQASKPVRNPDSGKSGKQIARTLLVPDDLPEPPKKPKPVRNPDSGKSGKQIARTLLVPDLSGSKKKPSSPVRNPDSGKSSKPIAKTLLVSDMSDPPQKAVPVRNPDSGSLSKHRPSKQFVAKTLLDRNMIVEASARFSARKIDRLAKVVAERLLEPQKPIDPVTAKKKVVGCPFSWSEDGKADRFQMCTQCQSNLYDFEGIDQSEAKAMIFKRENRESFVLYLREDGKFMTSVCPVSAKRKQKNIFLAAAAILAVAVIGTFFVLMPPQTETDSYYQAQNAESDKVHYSGKASDSNELKSSSASSSATDKDHRKGWVTKRIVIGKDAPLPSKPEEPTFSDAEEKGEFWKF